MAKFTLIVHASKAGSIGAKYGKKRHYTIEAPDRDKAVEEARRRAYAEGFEYARVTGSRKP